MIDGGEIIGLELEYCNGATVADHIALRSGMMLPEHFSESTVSALNIFVNLN